MKYLFGSALLAAVLLSGCGEKKEEQKNIEEPKPAQAQTAITKAAEDLKVTTNNAIDKGAQLAQEISEESKVIAKEMAEKSSEIAKEVVEQSKEMSKVAVEKAKEMTQDIDKAVGGMVSSNSVDAKTLFVKCSGCHGQKGEKKALGQSQIIQGWDKQKTIDAINGYKNGTYGGNMKTLMTSQVANLSAAEVEALADYIAKLKHYI